MFGHKTTHQPPFYQIAKTKRYVEIVGAEIELINSVLVRIKCLDPEFCRGRVHRDVRKC